MKRQLKAGKRHSGGFSLNTLTDDEVYEIHLATLEALQKTGVFVEDEEALEVFGSAGALVDPKKKIVKIPPYLVEDSIRSAPETFVACGRTPDRDIVLEHNRVSFTNFGEGIMFVDPYTGEYRKSVKADTEKAARLIDYLDNIATYERAMCSHDKPPAVQSLHNAEASLTNTTKHHWLGPQDGYLARKIVEILSAIVGGKERLKQRPLLTFVTCPVSPLKLVRHHCEIIMEAARNGLAVNIIGMAMAGGSAPIHLAGTLVLQNCEVLSSLVLNQLTCKGSPFVYGSSTCPLDLRAATSSVGCPELGMISAGVARLAQYYQLPCFVAGG
ncbi:MAG: trimethylamine methyltransferase family protein [Deltaproteobacteria bacterium]|nr:trimethylamine methyltransferase family protein [Deltaproteobacteria bacterium]MBW2122234.1 trimethylamine methyltransferase family protein [Deltaproteobacteria bacterium]